LPNLVQYERDLQALRALEDAADDDWAKVADLPVWQPTAYERLYVPGTRLIGMSEKSDVILQNSADLHIHTEYSDGDDLDRVLECAVAAGLDAIAITDHDEIRGAREARKRVHERRIPIAVIPGIEVSSRDGHIGGLFVTRMIPKGLSAAETIDLIHEAGGLAVAHHPFVPRWIEFVLRMKLGCRDLITTLPFDAIECTNAVPGVGVSYNIAATKQIRDAHMTIAVTGSSDAHNAQLIGKGRTYFAGNSGPVSLRAGIAHGFTQGAEAYWTFREKTAYYLHLAKAIVRNGILGRSSVN